MIEEEKTSNEISGESDVEIVKSWLAELGEEIRKKEEFLRKFEERPSEIGRRICKKYAEELPELRKTLMAYQELLKETEEKQ